MPEPERPANDTPARPNPGAKIQEDDEIPDEDAVDDAVSAQEAKDEARRLNAIPYERVRKDETP